MHNPITQQQAYDLYYGNYPMNDDSDPMITPYSAESEEGWVVRMGEGSYTNNLPNAPYEDAKLLAHAKPALKTIMWLWEQNQQQRDAINDLHATLELLNLDHPGTP